MLAPQRSAAAGEWEGFRSSFGCQDYTPWLRFTFRVLLGTGITRLKICWARLWHSSWLLERQNQPWLVAREMRFKKPCLPMKPICASALQSMAACLGCAKWVLRSLATICLLMAVWPCLPTRCILRNCFGVTSQSEHLAIQLFRRWMRIRFWTTAWRLCVAHLMSVCHQVLGSRNERPHREPLSVFETLGAVHHRYRWSPFGPFDLEPRAEFAGTQV